MSNCKVIYFYVLKLSVSKDFPLKVQIFETPSWFHFSLMGSQPSFVFITHIFIPFLYKFICFEKFLMTKVYRNHLATFLTRKLKKEAIPYVFGSGFMYRWYNPCEILWALSKFPDSKSLSKLKAVENSGSSGLGEVTNSERI